MGSIEFHGKTTIFGEGDRVSIALAGEGIPDGTRLSTKIDTAVGKSLSALLTTAQLQKFVEEITDTFVGASARDGALAIRLSTRTDTAVVYPDGSDLMLQIQNAPDLTSAQIGQLVDIAVRATRRIDAWKPLSLISTHPLANDLLTIADVRSEIRFDPINYYSLEFASANLHVSADGTPAVLVSEDVQESSWRRARDLMHRMPSQKDVPLFVMAENDGDTTKLFAEMIKAKRTMYFLVFHNDSPDRLSLHCPKKGESWNAAFTWSDRKIELGQVRYTNTKNPELNDVGAARLPGLLESFYRGKGESYTVSVAAPSRTPELSQVLGSLKGVQAEEEIVAMLRAEGWNISRLK